MDIEKAKKAKRVLSKIDKLVTCKIELERFSGGILFIKSLPGNNWVETDISLIGDEVLKSVTKVLEETISKTKQELEEL